MPTKRYFQPKGNLNQKAHLHLVCNILHVRHLFAPHASILKQFSGDTSIFDMLERAPLSLKLSMLVTPNRGKKLNLFLDDRGVLRSRGRTNRSEDLNFNQCNPILLPKCHFAKLVVMIYLTYIDAYK